MRLKTRYRLYQSLAFSLTFLSYAFYHAGRQPYSTTKLRPPAAQQHHLGLRRAMSPSTQTMGSVLPRRTRHRLPRRLRHRPLHRRPPWRPPQPPPLPRPGHDRQWRLPRHWWACGTTWVCTQWRLFAGADLASPASSRPPGWPGCVVVMTRWFDRAHMGTIMGVWNAHSSVGNIILGKYVGGGAAGRASDGSGRTWGLGCVVSGRRRRPPACS